MARKVPGYDKHIRVNRVEADRINLALDRELAMKVLSLRKDDLDALTMLGDTLTRLGAHEEALRIDRRIVALAPDEPLSHYNLACSCSNLTLIDEALESLSTAVDLGYADAAFMIRDPDLQNARRDPRFRTLLARLRQTTTG